MNTPTQKTKTLSTPVTCTAPPTISYAMYRNPELKSAAISRESPRFMTRQRNARGAGSPHRGNTPTTETIVWACAVS
jgi:hypothetical protein